jgi:hypothetical protein
VTRQEQLARQAGKQQEMKALEDLRLAKEAHERPLVEQYPALTAAPYLGGAVAGWSSYIPRARAVGLYNQFAARTAEAVKKAEAALQRAPNAAKTQQLLRLLALDRGKKPGQLVRRTHSRRPSGVM